MNIIKPIILDVIVDGEEYVFRDQPDILKFVLIAVAVAVAAVVAILLIRRAVKKRK